MAGLRIIPPFDMTKEEQKRAAAERKIVRDQARWEQRRVETGADVNIIVFIKLS
jgi:hypothetical protein